MVLQDLGTKITHALSKMSNAEVIDDEVLDACLLDISRALIQSDIKIQLVQKLRTNIKSKVTVSDLAGGINRRKVIEKAVFDELCQMMDSQTKPPKFTKGKHNVVMFVGLQGSGKTTSCTKFAYHYKKKGFKPALICADTFRAGAFDQLKQNSTKAQIPFYGSYKEIDPARIASEGVAAFKNDRDLIIVDTSGRHKQQADLFEEMKAVEEAVNPDAVIFVMDGSIGQAAFDQAKAFKDSVAVGSVIITKLDGNAKGGGALSAVAATQSPIIFLGTGEHLDQFEPFDTQSFVGRLLGKGDLQGFMNKVQEVIPDEKQPELMDQISKGNFSMRILYEQFQNILKMGPVSQIMSMMPGMSNASFGDGSDQASQAKIRRSMAIMDSMTDKELDAKDIKKIQEPSRIMRIARGAGVSQEEVMDLYDEYKRMSAMFKTTMKALPKGARGDGNMQLNPKNMSQMVNSLSKGMNPAMLKQMGGMPQLQEMMKEMAKHGGPGGMGGLPFKM